MCICMYICIYAHILTAMPKQQSHRVAPRGLGEAVRPVRATAAAVDPGAVCGAWGRSPRREGHRCRPGARSRPLKVRG